MKFTPPQRHTVQVILEGSYTPLDVREFVQFCYVLALPLIHSKISRGKLNLAVLGMKEVDIVYDCLADLFRRDSTGSFVQVRNSFAAQRIDPATSQDDEVLIALRRLVFGKVHDSIVRLYSEADPVLAKILRNLQLELEKNDLFEHASRFGETCLVLRAPDPALHLPPIPAEFLRQRFSQVASVRDSVPQMVEKLHQILSSQEEYRSIVPLVTVGLLFKEVYAVASDIAQADDASVERQSEGNDVPQIAEYVCRKLAASARDSYVRSRKRSEGEFERYIDAVKEILLATFGAMPADGVSYYDHLKSMMPGLTKGVYARRHRAILEYLAKRAKEQMRQELKRS